MSVMSSYAAAGVVALFMTAAMPASAQTQAPASSSAAAAPQGVLLCTSEPGERQFCAADTSAGVALVRSIGKAPCVRGESWDYDKDGITVSDGCSGGFLAGQAVQQIREK